MLRLVGGVNKAAGDGPQTAVPAPAEPTLRGSYGSPVDNRQLRPQWQRDNMAVVAPPGFDALWAGCQKATGFNSAAGRTNSVWKRTNPFPS